MKITRIYILVLFLALGIAAFVGIQSPENVDADSPQVDLYTDFPNLDGVLTRLETGIQVSMGICSKTVVLIEKGTTIFQFENDVSVNAEQTMELGREQTDEGLIGTTYCIPMTVKFDSNSLESGLNSIGFVIDPDDVIHELDETNNSGTVNLFHPDAYPDIVIEHIGITPDPVITYGTGPTDMNSVLLTVRFRNEGADMPRKMQMYLGLRDSPWWSTGSVIPPLAAGETYEWSSDFALKYGFEPKPTAIHFVVQDDLIAYTGDPLYWDYVLQDHMSLLDSMQPGQMFDLSAPLEIGTESVPQFNTCESLSCSGNNFTTIMVTTAKPPPYVLYPDHGKIFQFGSYPPLQSDWMSCVTCVPASVDAWTDEYFEWKLKWVDSILRFRWMPWWEENVRIEIHDGAGNPIHDIYIDKAALASSSSWDGTGPTSDETDYFFPDRPGLHDDKIRQFYLEERGWSLEHFEAQSVKFIFHQYDYDKSALEPGLYRWRMKFDDPDAPDEVEPWSSWREFVVKKAELDLNNLTYLDHPGFFGDVTEVSPSTLTAQITKFTTVTEAGDVSLWRTGQTVTSNLQAPDQQLLEVGNRVAVVADRSPAVGKDLPDHVLAVAEQITVIPREPLRKHRKCVAVEKEGNTSTLTCDDGTTVELSNEKLNPGDNVVVLFHPKRPAQLVSTATELLDRLTSMTNQAAEQGNTELASELDDMYQNTEKTFADKFSEIRDAASPNLKAAMDSMISSIKGLAGEVAAGDTEVVISAETLLEVIANMEQMLDSMDEMTEIMVSRRLNRIPEEARDEVEATIRSETEEVITQVKKDMEETLEKLRNGEVENGITVMEATLFNMDRETADSSVRIQVQSILDQLRTTSEQERKITEVTVSCPSSTKTGKQIKCSFHASGKIASVTWSMPGASPDFIEQPNFTSESAEKKVSIEFDVPGTFEVSLEACNENGCSVVSSSVEVSESEPIQTGEVGNAPEITLQCPSTAETGEQIQCSFQYSGKVDTVSWVADEGTVKTSSEHGFSTTFEKDGVAVITLKACDNDVCTENSHALEVTESTSVVTPTPAPTITPTPAPTITPTPTPSPPTIMPTPTPTPPTITPTPEYIYPTPEPDLPAPGPAGPPQPPAGPSLPTPTPTPPMPPSGDGEPPPPP